MNTSKRDIYKREFRDLHRSGGVNISSQIYVNIMVFTVVEIVERSKQAVLKS